MTSTINEKSTELVSQTKTLEMPSSLRMIELSKTYLMSIEKKFGTFLHKLGIDIGNYDEKLIGNSTGAEKIYNQKILPLKHKIEKEKHELKKHELMTQLTKHLLEARGIDLKEVEKLAKSAGKENEFKKEFVDARTDEEKTKKEIENHFKEIDKAYIKEEKSEEKPNREKLIKDISDKNIQAMEDYRNGKITKMQYESIIVENMNKARIFNVEKFVSENIGSFLKTLGETGSFGMQSGVLPVAMMITPVVKKAVPMLPVVVGGGIYYRLYNDTLLNNEKGVGEKTWETTKVGLYTVASIAPITGSIIAINDAVESWDNLKKGTGSKSDAIASTIGAGVSIIFDGVTIVMAATGVGLAPAAGVATGRKAAVEGTKFGIKKFAGKIGDLLISGKNGLIDSFHSTKALFGFKTIEETIKKEGSEELIKTGKMISGGFDKDGLVKVWKEIGKDTLRGAKDVLTFKFLRDRGNALLFKTPKFGEFYQKLRPTKYSELREIGIAGRLGNGNESLNKELEYIDSKKYSLDAGATKELLDLVDTKMKEISNNSKKIKRLEDKERINTHTQNDSELSRKIDDETSRLEKENIEKMQVINKLFDILDYRARKISDSGNKELENDNKIMWIELHNKLKSYLANDYLGNDVKIDVIKGLWPTSIREHNYLKNGDIQKLANDILNGNNDFSKKADFILLMGEKGLLNDIKIDDLNITGKTIEILKTLNGEDLIKNSHKLNKLFESIPGLNINKNLINKISDEIAKSFKNREEIENPGTHIEAIGFMSENGTLNRIIGSNYAQITPKIESYINALTIKDYNVRGALNMANYFKGTKLEPLMNTKLEELFGKDFKLPEAHKNSLGSKIQELDSKIDNFMSKKDKESIQKDMESIQKDITNLLSSSDESLNFSNKEIIRLFEKYPDLIKINGVKELLYSKFDAVETHIEVKNLIGKILGKIDGENIKINLKLNLSSEDIILMANKKFTDSKEDIGILKEYMSKIDYAFRENPYLNKYDFAIALDTLKNNYEKLKGNNNSDLKSFCQKYENFVKNTDIDNKFLDELKGTAELTRLVSLGKVLGLELKSDFKNGGGFYLFSKENGNKYVVDFSKMSNMKNDLRDLIISNSPLTNGKYFENIGFINQKSVSTHYEDKINSSENAIFNDILSYNRDLNNFKFSDEGYAKLLGEYHIESFGERFNKKVILSNHLIKIGKIDIVKEAIINDIKNPNIPAEIKMSLIHNIQVTSIRDDLFKELINSKDALNLIDYQHDLFKKLAFKIDNEAINTNVINNINNIKGKVLAGEGVKELDALISIIQHSKNISSSSEAILMSIFREIKGKVNKINSDKINEHYMKLLIEFGRIEKLRDQPEVLDNISSNISSRNKQDPLFGKALQYGLLALKRYHNFDTVRFGEAGIKGLSELKRVIDIKIGVISSKMGDLFELKNDGTKILYLNSENIGNLGNDLIKSLSDVGTTPTKIIGNELYVKIDGTGKELSFSDLIKYKEALVKLKSIQKDIIGAKAGDIFNENMGAYKDILAKAGFDTKGYIEYKKSGKIDENINSETKDFILIGRNTELGVMKKLDNSVKGVVNNDLIEKTSDNSELKTKVEENSNLVKMSPDIPNTTHDINDFNLPSDLKTKITELFGNKISRKALFGILITFGIMTTTEAQAANNDIEQSWKSSPEYKKYLDAKKAGKEQEAIQIQRNAIEQITRTVLDQFLSELSNRSREGVRSKVGNYSLEVRTIMSDLYVKGGNALVEKDKKTAFNSQLAGFIDIVNAVYERKPAGNAEKIAKDIKSSFTFNDGGKFIDELIKVGRSMDNADSRSKIGAMLKNLK